MKEELCGRCQKPKGAFNYGAIVRGEHVFVCHPCGTVYQDLHDARKEHARIGRLLDALERDWNLM